MSLYKGPDGIYHADIRVVDVGRWHGSMGTRKKADAQPKYDAVRRLFREAKGPNGAERRALIDDLRSGDLSVDRLESMVAHGEPLVRSRPATAAALPKVDAAIKRYLDWIHANPKRRAETWRSAHSGLQRFAAFEYGDTRLGSLSVDAVTSEMIEAYQRSLMDAKAATNTVTNYMARVNALWAWMQRLENRSATQTRRVAVTIHSPIDRETLASEKTHRDRWLTKQEAAALVLVTPPRLQIAVAMALFGGFRIGEILHLRTHVDIDLALGTISIAPKQVGVADDGSPIMWKPKTDRSNRVVPISTDLRPFLENHLAVYASDSWLMPGIMDSSRPFEYDTLAIDFSTAVANAGMIAGRKDPRGVVFHTLRHTFASWLVMAGVDLYTVAQLLGDTLKMVEETYAHLAPDYKRRAIEALKGALTLPVTPSTIVQNTAAESATTGGV